MSNVEQGLALGLALAISVLCTVLAIHLMSIPAM
jgi:hypothetical protein